MFMRMLPHARFELRCCLCHVYDAGHIDIAAMRAAMAIRRFFDATRLCHVRCAACRVYAAATYVFFAPARR